MINRILYLLLLFFVLFDLGYSFLQHYGADLDGDIAVNIVPGETIAPIFESPLGLNTILNQESYPNPNRFFCHWAFKEYLINTPLFLQKFVDPIDSIYLANAIAKTLIQLALIILLAIAITGTTKVLSMDFILAAALITPLFQSYGYGRYMGIIDPSITYTFFYALPSALLILYFLPLFRQVYQGKPLQPKWLILIFWLPMGIVVSLSGPLNTGVVLITACLAFLGKARESINLKINIGIVKQARSLIQSIPTNYWLYLLPISLFSVYSLFIGQYNSNNDFSPISLGELYLRLPEGVFYQVTQKLGYPLLLISLMVNVTIMLSHLKSRQSYKILSAIKWIGLFALLYILLLPLGGYRDYRANTLRYDTILPITLMLLFAFGMSTLFIIKNIKKSGRYFYYGMIVLVLCVFTFADEPNFDRNACERAALVKISKSQDSVVQISGSCPVLSWYISSDPEESAIKGELLCIWKVTSEKKQFYH